MSGLPGLAVTPDELTNRVRDSSDQSALPEMYNITKDDIIVKRKCCAGKSNQYGFS